MHVCTCVLFVRCTGEQEVGCFLIVERLEEGIKGPESIMTSDIQAD